MTLHRLLPAILTALLLGNLSPSPGIAGNSRPNIVILFADDLGYGDLSSYGSTDIRTPSIDSIGRDGIRFTQFYVNSPECTPSRVALLTGRYQQRVGGLECAIGSGNVGRYDEAVWLRERNQLGLPTTESTISSSLKKAGYDTAIVGKWHLGYEPHFAPKLHGFSESFVIVSGGVDYFSHVAPDGNQNMFHNGEPVTKDGYITDIFTDKAIEWISQPRSKPYFLYLPYTTPHSPFQGPDDGPLPPDSPLWRQGNAPPEVYRAMIEHMDKRIGDLLKVIDRSPDRDNTIVIFLSDNGATGSGSNGPLRGLKGRLWEGGIRIPCVIRWPAKIPAGLESDQVASSIDLTTTLLAAAKIPASVDHPVDGIDITGTLTGELDPFPRTVFWRYKRGENRRHAVRQGDLKYVVQNEIVELFDLSNDLGETRNLLPYMREKAIELETKFRAWEAEVAAPRLRDFPGISEMPPVKGLTGAVP